MKSIVDIFFSNNSLHKHLHLADVFVIAFKLQFLHIISSYNLWYQYLSQN